LDDRDQTELVITIDRNSQLIAIIAGESDADDLADLLEADRLRLCSALGAGRGNPHSAISGKSA
jgi:hypothetical protein